MALQFNYTDPATLVVAPTCYARLLSLHIDALTQTIDVAVGLYLDAAARTAGGTPLAIYHAWPPFAAIMGGPVNIPVAAYNFVKTQPGFTSATDVL